MAGPYISITMKTNKTTQLIEIKWPIILALVAALSACATGSHNRTSTAEDGIQVHDEGVAIDPFYKVPDSEGDIHSQGSMGDAPHISSNPTSGTVLALLTQAKQQEKAGNPEKAAAVLERALRIEPKNPQLWYRLALLRLQQGELDLARSFANKSIALAQGDDELQAKNRTIIEQVELLQGY